MDDGFNELDDLDNVEIDLDDETQIDDYDYDDFYSNYSEYDDDDSNDDYFTVSSYERLEEDNYDEDDIDEEISEKPNNFRNLILKVVVLILIAFLVIWGVSTLVTSNKKDNDNSNDVTVIKNDEINTEETFTKIKEAAAKYYKEDNISEEVGKKVSVKKLMEANLIDKISNSYDTDKSNVVLNVQDDKYSLKILLVDNNDSEKSKVYSLDNYSYCTGVYLCEEQEVIETDVDEKNEDDDKEYLYEYVLDNATLSNWSKWTEYEKTDCNTQKIVCSSNDSNCLTEVKLYQRKEKVGTHNKIYESSRLAFSTNNTEQIKVCSKYDYVKINNVYYRTENNSNYKVLGAIKKDTQKDYYNWKYNGRASYTTPPSDTINTRYVFVGPDYTNCTNTCGNNLKYYYDSYTFSKALTKTNKPSDDCSNKTTEVVANYSIVSQKISFSRSEELYGTVCYKSYRTRSLNNSGSTKWSYYNDQELLNNGYKYTGNKKEK